jgi:hypothetical protein
LQKSFLAVADLRLRTQKKVAHAHLCEFVEILLTCNVHSWTSLNENLTALNVNC